MNDKLTSMRIEPYDHRNHGAVNVFSDSGCAGYAAAFEFEGGNGGTGFTEIDMMREGIPRNSASSVMVPMGYYVDIWSDDGLRGSKKTIVGFTDPQGRMPCVELGWMNNKASSLEVKQIEEGSAIGFWDSITTTETQEFEYTVGIV